MKYNTIFMYDTCTYDMYNYDIKYNVEFLKEEYKSNIRKIGTPFGTLAGQFETLARRTARWHVYCHVGT